MKTRSIAIACASLLALPVAAADDARTPLELPPMMVEQILADMRDHLAVVNELIALLGRDELDAAAELAEQRLGLSSMAGSERERHLAHMRERMPDGFFQMGHAMHAAASRFARTASEGDSQAAFSALGAVTAACVACHDVYRLR